MLRFLKQKAKGGAADDSIMDSKGGHPWKEPDSPTDEITIVSHVPISISIHSAAAPSTDSSLSSRSYMHEDSDEDEHIVTMIARTEPSSRSSQQPDSRNESSSETVDIGPFSTPSACVECPSKPLARRRRVSVEDMEYSGTAAPARKKRRQDKLTSSAPPPSKITLLASNEDDYKLSPLHAFIRKQIEVFRATSVELMQPAPGRKQPIKLHQVGLRCIHCKNNPSSERRVKRAVCYPSHVGRVYHSVSDMKFDHFNHCTSLPPDVKATFETLKAARSGRRSADKNGEKGTPSSSTAQYYHDTAARMGMYDGPGGIFMAPFPWNSLQHGYLPLLAPKNLTGSFAQTIACNSSPLQKRKSSTNRLIPSPKILNSPPMTNVLSFAIQAPPPPPVLEKTFPVLPGNPACTTQTARMTLHEDSDMEHLNEIHCFVRKHLEVFAASKEDTTAPSPGRKTRVVVGQVGIRCIHCAKLPTKDRVKRAICYPPGISGIYHAVSNMKFDHFAICPGLPEHARQEFATMREACSRRGSAGNNNSNITSRGSSNSTAKYYQESAIRKGLIDTGTGIRFGPAVRTEKDLTALSAPPPVLTGMSALVKAACQAA